MTPGEGILRLAPTAGQATEYPALGPASEAKPTFRGCIRARVLTQQQRAIVAFKPPFDVVKAIRRSRTP